MNSLPTPNGNGRGDDPLTDGPLRNIVRLDYGLAAVLIAVTGLVTAVRGCRMDLVHIIETKQVEVIPNGKITSRKE